MQSIILCADDFGYNHSISLGIIHLAEKKRLNAISCLSTFPGWARYAPLLQSLTHCAIGLHLNLTQSITPISITPLMIRSYLHCLDKKRLDEQIYQQFDAFVQQYQKLPHFIDGHQHVHQLPQVRDALVDFYQKHLLGNPCWIRLAANPMHRLLRLPYRLKQTAIYASGYQGLKRLLRQYHIPYNSSFAGIYPFRTKNYRRLFQKFLAASCHSGVIMCHPGFQSQNDNDPIAFSRWQEFQYFSSDDFKTDCRNYGCLLGHPQDGYHLKNKHY